MQVTELAALLQFRISLLTAGLKPDAARRLRKSRQMKDKDRSRGGSPSGSLQGQPLQYGICTSGLLS